MGRLIAFLNYPTTRYVRFDLDFILLLALFCIAAAIGSLVAGYLINKETYKTGIQLENVILTCFFAILASIFFLSL